MGLNEGRRRRDRLEIIEKILDVAGEGSVKTRIMYRTNMNFTQFEQHVCMLLEAGLIEIISAEKGRTYKTTDKGHLLLQRLRETSWIFDEMKGEEILSMPIIQRRENTYFIKRTPV
ncbi:MAG TPA: winged helix-turn-helix domain-containing protein [Candidatus Bathyarchaeia archaeon]